MELVNDMLQSSGSRSSQLQRATTATSRAFIPADDIKAMKAEALESLKVLNSEREISIEEWGLILSYVEDNVDSIPGLGDKYLNMAKAKAALERKRGQDASKEYFIRMNEKPVGVGTMEWFNERLEARKSLKRFTKLSIAEGIDKNDSDAVSKTRLLARRYVEGAYCRRVMDDHRKIEASTGLAEQFENVARWITGTNYNGLLIRGGVGVGKSTMMRAISDVYFIIDNKTVTEVSAVEICNSYINDRNRFNELCRIPMLAIDDMGTEPATILHYGNPISPMVEIIDERYRDLRFTIITTNLTEEKIKEIYGPRTFDRLKQLCGFLKYGGETKSYR